MGKCIFGSARHDENGKLQGGKSGDNLQSGSGNDFKGEVSLQTGYVHSKGWVILRPKSDDLAHRLAYAMLCACNNKNIGYDQGNRLAILSKGIDTKTATECDCSSLVRACLKHCGIETLNFTTANALTILAGTGMFNIVQFTNLDSVQTGDILNTKSKGHIVVCVEGKDRGSTKPTLAKATIKQGNSGTQVKNLQNDLNYFMGCGLSVDGNVGPKTIAALKKWQTKYGLVADGSYGPKSEAKMKQLLS